MLINSLNQWSFQAPLILHIHLNPLKAMHLKKRKKSGFFIIVISLAALAFMLTVFWPKDIYHIDRYIENERQDSLMTSIVTYMGVKPRRTDWQTRLEPQYRSFYAEQAKEYSFYRYFADEKGTHYFYIIRPARHPMGNRRAVGGKYILDEQMNLHSYEEVFVTQVLEEEYLKEIADDLFTAFVNDQFEKYLNNRLIIEWPDDRLKYDTLKKEWRYDVTP